MIKDSQKQYLRWLAYFLVLCVGLYCRELNENRTLLVSTLLGAAQTIIYTGLVAFWGVSVRYRIVQPQIRMLLESISILLFTWFLQRGIKYYVMGLFTNVENIKRYMWYSYYIPMLLLPVVMLLVAWMLRKPDTYRLPKKVVGTLFFVSTILFLLVITNDFHQFVFKFPKNAVVFTDADYSYNILYYPCFAWMVGCIITSLVTMIRKCRLPKSRKVLWLPLVPMVFCLCYVMAYNTGNIPFFNDIIIVDSFLLIAILESAIVVGLIPSNTHYAELFKASNLPILITNGSFEPVFVSDDTITGDKGLLKTSMENGSVTKGGMRVSAYPITCGHVFWQEDITELMEVTEELAQVQEEVKEEYAVTQEAYQTSHRRQMLVEKNRLYNIMQSETQQKVKTLSTLTEKLVRTEQESEMGSQVVEAAVLCAYLKRRNNLLFLKEDSDVISGVELTYCIKESLNSFALSGATVVLRSELSMNLSFVEITRLYDVFEIALETALHTTRELFVTLQEKNGAVFLYMDFVCSSNLSHLTEMGFVVDQEDEEEWVLEYAVREGGDAV